MNEFISIQTTTNNQAEAEKLAAKATEEKLAACAQIDGPFTSVYWWNGVLEKDEEWRCSFKTTRQLFEALEKRIKELHSYETPEIIAVEIVAGSKDYLDWIRNEVK